MGASVVLGIIIIFMLGLLLYGAYSNGWFYTAAKSVGLHTDLPTGDANPNPDSHTVIVKESEKPTNGPSPSSTPETSAVTDESSTNATPAADNDAINNEENTTTNHVFKILDGKTFSIGPHSIKKFEFKLSQPIYPIRITGDMTTASTSHQVAFRLYFTGSVSPIALMSAGYTQAGVLKVTHDVISKYGQNYVDIDSHDVPASLRDNPSFTAVFENTDDGTRTVTANLIFTYSNE